MSRLGKSGDMEVVKEARKRFEDHFNSSSSSKLNGDLKKAVRKYCKLFFRKYFVIPDFNN